MQSKFTRLVFVFILYNYLIINETIVLFRYAVFSSACIFEIGICFLYCIIQRRHFLCLRFLCGFAEG